MINFPEATKVGKRIPKESFYKHLQLNTTLKDSFISDVDRIVVENSLTNDSLNLSTESDIGEILVLSMFLKKKEFDIKIIESIARQNPHKILFTVKFEDIYQYAIYQRKLYRTEWLDNESATFELKSYSLDYIWDGLVEQIALHEERASIDSSMTIEDRLAIQEQIIKLEKLIAKTETAAWKEQQPKKRFEIYSRLQNYKTQLEELKHGKA